MRKVWLEVAIEFKLSLHTWNLSLLLIIQQNFDSTQGR